MGSHNGLPSPAGVTDWGVDRHGPPVEPNWPIDHRGVDKH